MTDQKQIEQQEQDELHDLDVPDEQAEDVKAGTVAASGSDISPWTTTHGNTRRP